MKRIWGVIIAAILLITEFCSKSVLREVYAAKDYPVGSIILFGNYPQSVVTDPELIKRLDDVYENNPYAGITLDGEKYIRQETSGINNIGGFDFGIEYKYFKYEPIRWRVLSYDGERFFLMSDKAIGYIRMGHEFSGSDLGVWINSRLKSDLNDFYRYTLTEAEREAVCEVEIAQTDNPVYGIKGSEKTKEHIFLLSYEDVTNPAYGFSSVTFTQAHEYNGESDNSSAYRQVVLTDYAAEQFGNAIFDLTKPKYTDWWLRTPGRSNSSVMICTYDGKVDAFGNDDQRSNGLVPALYLDAKSKVWTVGEIDENSPNRPEEDGKDNEETKPVFTFPGNTEDEDSITLDYTGQKFTFSSKEWNLSKLLDNEGIPDESLAKISLIMSARAEYDGNNCQDGKDAVDDGLISLGLVEDTEHLAGNDKTDYRWHTSYVDIKSDTEDAVCGNTIALKKYYHDNRTYNIITVVCRGTTLSDGEDVWLDVKDNGFITSASKVYSDLTAFLSSHNLSIKNRNNRYFIMGHSLGGATANLISYFLTLAGCYTNDITCYTFACPFTTFANDNGPDMPHGANYAFNFLRDEDIITHASNSYEKLAKCASDQFVNDIAPVASIAEMLQIYKKSQLLAMRYGKDIYIDWNDGRFKELYEKYTGKHWGNINGTIKKHVCETYMAALMTDIESGQFAARKSYITKHRFLGVYCPVNIDLREAASGKVVAEVRDGNIYQYDESVSVCAVGDAKFFLYEPDAGYILNLEATDSGALSCVIEDYNGDEAPVTERFDDIKLVQGKKMICTLPSENVQASDLYVTDGFGGVISIVTTDGSELETTVSNEETAIRSVMAPAKATITGFSKVNGKKNKAKVSWNALNGATGYQVQIATNKKFTKGKQTKTVKKATYTFKKLKTGKTYYVRVRAYVIDDTGKKIFGNWSKTKKKKM